MKILSERRVLLLLLVTPLLLFIQFVISFIIYQNIRQINDLADANALVDQYLRTTTRDISSAESAVRGYLLSGDSSYMLMYSHSVAELKKNLEFYDSLPNNLKPTPLRAIQPLLPKKLGVMSLTLNLYKAGKADSALAVFKTGYGKRLTDTITTASRDIRDQLSINYKYEKKHEMRFLYALFAVIGVLIVFNLFMVFYTYKAFKNYTARLVNSVNMLEDANRRLTEFSFASYHELKTPLRNITGFLQLLRKKYDQHLDAEAMEFVNYITDGVKQMNETINTIRKKNLENTQL
ncbi:MAG TPA: CHASE3 domain-containing protein [Chitinophagales bacterium]|nr:CHASE3 domain-containing protein [Chitinophagales bacterium]